MDSNSNSSAQSTTCLRTKREQLRGTLRRQELELQFQSKRKQLHHLENELLQKQEDLKLEQLIVFFNKQNQLALEAVLLYEWSDAIVALQNLSKQLKQQDFKNFKNSKEIDTDVFEQLVKQIEVQSLEDPSELQLMLLQDLIDEVCSLLSEEDQLPNNELQLKALQQLQHVQYDNALLFLKKFHRNSQVWYQAVLRQKLVQLDDDMIELVMKGIPNQDAWLILMPLQNLPYNEQLVQLTWKYKHTERGFAFLKKTLSIEPYLNRYLHMNLFSAFAQVYQQCELKQYFGTQILDCMLSVCCIKMELFDKLISSGLIQMFSVSKLSDYSYEGFYNLYRIAYWLKSNNSQLFQNSLNDELWYQNILKLCIQQQINVQVQQSACDLIKYYLQLSGISDSFKLVLKQDQLPDNISSQLMAYLI